MANPCAIFIDDPELAKKLGVEVGKKLSYAEFAEKVNEGLLNDEVPSANKNIIAPEKRVDATKSEIKDASNIPSGISKRDIPKDVIDAALNGSDRAFVSEGLSKTWNKVVDGIHDGTIIIQDIIHRIKNTDSVPSREDFNALIYQKTELNVRIKQQQQAFLEAQKNGNQTLMELANINLDALQQVKDDLYVTIDYGRSKAGSALGSLRGMTDDKFDYSYLKADIERSQDGKPLSREQEKILKQVEADYKDAQDKLEEYRLGNEKWKEDQLKNDADKRKAFEDDLMEKMRKGDLGEPKPKSDKISNQGKLLADKVRKLKSKPLILLGADGKPLYIEQSNFYNNAVEMVAKAIEEAAKTGDKVIDLSNIIKDVLEKQGFYNKLSDADKGAALKSFKDHFKDIDTKSTESLAQKVIDKGDGVFDKSLRYSIKEVLRSVVENDLSVDYDDPINYKNATKKVFDAIKDGFPDLTIEQVRDLIGGYGDYKSLPKDDVSKSLREIAALNQAEAAQDAILRGELPHKSGMERHKAGSTAREMRRKNLRDIKEKGLLPPVTDAEVKARFKTADEQRQTRLNHAIEDVEKELKNNKLREKRTKKEGAPKSDKTIALEQKLDRLNKLRGTDLKDQIATEKLSKRKESTQEAIDDINAKIKKIQDGTATDAEMLPTKAQQKITDAKLDALRNERDALKEEMERLLPQNIKDQIATEKLSKRRDVREKQLNEQIKNKEFAPREKPKQLPYNQKIAEQNQRITQLERTVKAEKAKIKRGKEGNVERVLKGLALLKRADIFTTPLGIARLTGAAMLRFVGEPFHEFSNLALSNLPISKKVFQKDLSMYTKSGKLAVKTIGTYMRDPFKKTTLDSFGQVVAKSTFKTALSEFSNSGQSLWEKYHTKDVHVDEFTSKTGKKIANVLRKPQQSHGFLKAFPKMAKLRTTYEKVLHNMQTMINPETGGLYDITHPETQQKAMKMAEAEALRTVFMNENSISTLIKQGANKLQESKSIYVQALGGYINQLMPVLKIPLNWVHEELSKIPLVGTVEALSLIQRSGERGTKNFRGIKNLTQEQAHDVAVLMNHQVTGLIFYSLAVPLYMKYGDDIIKKIKKYDYYLHSTDVMMLLAGLEAQKAIKEGGGVVESVVDVSKATAKEGVTKTPVLNAATNTVNILRNSKGLSDAAKKMGADLLVPAGIKQLAEKIDDYKVRDPETFKELVEVQIPGLRDLVALGDQIEPLRSNNEVTKATRFMDKWQDITPAEQDTLIKNIAESDKQGIYSEYLTNSYMPKLRNKFKNTFGNIEGQKQFNNFMVEYNKYHNNAKIITTDKFQEKIDVVKQIMALPEIERRKAIIDNKLDIDSKEMSKIVNRLNNTNVKMKDINNFKNIYRKIKLEIPEKQ